MKPKWEGKKGKGSATKTWKETEWQETEWHKDKIIGKTEYIKKIQSEIRKVRLEKRKNRL